MNRRNIMVKLILDYEEIAHSTDKFKQDNIQPILLGLFGEVGSIMAAVKKRKRENKAFFAYEKAVMDELGDAFWYFTALTRRYGLSVSEVISGSVVNNINPALLQANENPQYPVVQGLGIITGTNDISQALIKLGQATASLLEIESVDQPKRQQLLGAFAAAFFEVTLKAKISFKEILEFNNDKTIGHFSPISDFDLPDFDKDFPHEEQLPRKFKIKIKERKDGRVYMQMKGVFIGSLLTDNIKDEDFFRFHDALHFAHVAILHWSPSIRGLLKRKRKSKPDFDENQDGGRGVLVEEGLTAWVFSKAKDLEYFEGHKTISIDIIKTIKDFVKGYEVQDCPAALWEKAILDGYKVFRKVKDKRGGYIIGDRDKRTLTYKPLKEEDD